MVKKKILVTSGNLFPPRGGAEKSLFAFLKKMAFDFNVTLLAPANTNRVYRSEGYSIRTVKNPFYLKLLKSYPRLFLQHFWWKKVLKNYLKKEKFDILITQSFLESATAGIRMKKINFVRGTGVLFSSANTDNPFEFENKSYFSKLPFIFKLQYPLVRFLQKKRFLAAIESNIVITNSIFMKNLFYHYSGKRSEVIYPPIDKKEYSSSGKKSDFKVIFIRPTLSKGVDMMLGIARKMSNTEFIVVGKTDIQGKKYYRRLIRLKNVKHLEEQIDMSKIYIRGKLLVSPTSWHEPFGRTPAEAGFSGIPSVVPNKGGLPEVVEKSGSIVDDYNNVDSWVREIEKYKNKEFYDKKSILARKQSEKFSLDNQYKRLKKIIDMI